MRKLNKDQIININGGYELPRGMECLLWSSLFPPITIGCIMKEIDFLSN
ncbi:hypothetical protein [Pedobacter planticolens]|nr:hypothetical protein [Pedobacter planticolens]